MLKLEEPQKLKKVRLGFYPYTYVRATVMKSLLFKKEDYQKMLKMGFSEIAKYLQDSHYKKLMRISSYELGLLIKEYTKRKDIEDIKTILRGKFTNADEKLILNSITAAGTLSYVFLVSLLKKESIEDVLKHNSLVDFSLLKAGLKDLKEKNNLIGIENALDRCYYN